MMILNLKQEFSLIVGINEHKTIRTTTQYRCILLQCFQRNKIHLLSFWLVSEKYTNVCFYFQTLCFALALSLMKHK